MPHTLYPVLIVLPLVVFTTVLLATSGSRYEFDYAEKYYFFGLLPRFRDIAMTIFISSIVLILAGGVYLGEVEACTLLAGAAVYSLLFITWLVLQYEMYLHVKYPLNPPVEQEQADDSGTDTFAPVPRLRPSPYTSVRYSITWALGATSVVAFALGLFSFVFSLGGR